MSKVGVSLKIDVSKIEKGRLFKGQKGTYLDATVFIDLDQLDQYGNSGMVTQDVTKEEKDQGVKGPILGNCKVFWSDSRAQPQQQAPHNQPQGGFNQQPQQGVQQPHGKGFNQPTPPPTQGFDDFDDDIPFN